MEVGVLRHGLRDEVEETVRLELTLSCLEELGEEFLIDLGPDLTVLSYDDRITCIVATVVQLAGGGGKSRNCKAGIAQIYEIIWKNRNGKILACNIDIESSELLKPIIDGSECDLMMVAGQVINIYQEFHLWVVASHRLDYGLECGH